MTAGELEKRLASGESRGAGQKRGGDESTGHASGRRFVMNWGHDPTKP